MSGRAASLAAAICLLAGAAAAQAPRQTPGGESLAKGWTAPTGAADDADVARGERLWGKCRACHTYRAGERHSVGPNLHGLFGRRAGAAPGYRRYSGAMGASTVVWTQETLDGYLAATTEFMPGTKMYAGLAIPRDRLDLIAWLREVAGEVAGAGEGNAENP